ncbi:MAG: S46 family peptidase [Sinimarinibacterium flocculans]|uniref:S46 family peptidase n=1 Tax=Sinimarinibacterium flocculans TaxID=985250 RepID=UPI003C584E30
MMVRTAVMAGVVFVLAAGSAHSAEGMWTLDNLPRESLRERYGFEPDEAWVEQLMQASVRLASGCSGSFVSGEGLVLTNAHCVLRCVGELSGAEADYVNDGFVATARENELRCPAEELNRLESITDVSARIDAATDGRSGQAFIDARNGEKARIEAECVGDDAATVRCDVVELYGGGMHHLYRYRRYQDVRLAFSPEYRIGFFGGDPDNFNFPRYNLDMGLLRAYEDGQPVATDAHLSLRREGAEEGELVMVTGHPGKTRRLLTASQLERLRDVDLVNQLLYLSERRALLWQYGRSGEEAARQAQADLTLTENRIKVYRGQLAALQRPELFARRRADALRLRATAKTEDGDPWAAIASAQQAYRRIEAPYQMAERALGFDSEYFKLARDLVRAGEERAKPNAQRLREYQDAALTRLQQTVLTTAPIYPAYEETRLAWSLSKLRERLGPDDPLVKLVLGRESPEALAAKLVAGTELGDVDVRRKLWDGGFEAVSASTDPFIQLARAVDSVSRDLRQRYETQVEAVENKQAAVIARLRFAAFGDALYPDATFSLRLSYGEVRGWEENGRKIEPFTRIGGLFSRATGAEPFALPPSWRKVESTLDMETPFNFVTTNDIIGGNSGSPVINRNREVVGLAFDTNIHALGGAFGYDETLNRCVAVHSAAMLESLEKVYGAGTLAREMTAN